MHPLLAAALVVVSLSDLNTRAPWGPLAGTQVALEPVKFQGVLDLELRVAGAPRDRLLVDDEALRRELARFRGGALARDGSSNVRVVGIARDAPIGRTIHVTAVERLEDDGPLHARLVREAATTDAALAVARRARTIGVADATVAPLASRALTASPDERSRIESVLERELDAVTHHGRWIARSELRRALGLVPCTCSGDATPRWIRRERAELDEAIAAHGKQGSPHVRTLLDSDYERAARARRIVPGMTRVELAIAVGYPTSVERVVSGRTWEAWALADGRRVFLRDGEVFAFKDGN